MKQSRVMSLVETAVNILVGVGVAMLANAIILPWLGFDISFKQNLIFGVAMTVVSIVRSYGLRRLFEALHIRRPLSPFMQAVIAERYRQIEVEGWSLSNDDERHQGELAQAAAAYAISAADRCLHPSEQGPEIPLCWPWNRQWWKPQNFRRDLVRACALILAEGERFDRQRKSSRRTLVPSSASEPSMKDKSHVS